MTKITVTTLVCVAAAIGLLASFPGQAQTPEQAWSTLLGDKQTGLQPNRIRIEYEEPRSEELKRVYWTMLRRRPLQRVREIFSPLRLPVELTVRMKECGVSNAWYQRPTITLCYEYVREMEQMAPKETSPEGITPVDAVVGQFLYTASHEMGHAVFDLLSIPLFGPPEADADQFAAHTLVTIGKQDAPRLIEGAAYMYKDYFKNPSITVPVTAFADVHGAPMQRMYDLTCLAYGSDPELFAYVIEKNYLPKNRAPSCRREWAEVDYAFHQLIYPFFDKKLADDVLSKSWVPRRRAPAPQRTTDVPQTTR
jgi:hypothetical protein